jgi:hypothetical protein
MDDILCALKNVSINRYLSGRFALSAERAKNIDLSYSRAVAGLVVVLYDHVLTFGDEVRLIWAAPRSFAKWIFLVNRYLTEVCLLAVANGACIAVP